MRTDRIAGTALIVGAIGAIVTMVLHPVGGSFERIARQAGMIRGVHALAIVSITVEAFALLRFSQLIPERRSLADAGLVAFALAAISGILAATVSGLLSPHIAEHALEAGDAAQGAWHVAFAYNFMLNGVLSNVFITATAVAVALWSAAMLGTGTQWTILGVAGLAVGAGAIAALFTGRLQHNVHDVALFIFAMSAWMVALGILLCQSTGAPSVTPPPRSQ